MNRKPLFTYAEIEEAFESLLQGKIKNKRKSYAFESIGFTVTGSNTSLLPVGTDGMTTMHVLKNKQTKEHFLNEIYRLINECNPNTDIPRIELKKYKIKEIVTNETKKRVIVIPCLRDQVVVRCILNRLNTIGITSEENKPNPKVDVLTKKIRNIINADNRKKIIRTDISNYYPSVDVNILLRCLEVSHGKCIGAGIMHLIRKILIDNKSKDSYTGLPVGVGFCVLLANYYIGQMALSTHFAEAEIIRYEDDFLFIINENEDEQAFLAKLDQIFFRYGISRNLNKTEILNTASEFKFIGVNYKEGKVSLGEEKMKQWKIRVVEDIKKQFRDFAVVKSLHPGIEIPSNTKIVNTIWKDHKKGLRSKTYRHSLRIKGINEEKGLVA